MLKKVVKDNHFNFDVRIVFTSLNKHKVDREQVRQVFGKPKAEEPPADAQQPPHKKVCIDKK